METDILTICDSADYRMGKLHIEGVITHIYAIDAPAIREQFHIAALLRFAEDEQGLKHVRVEMIDTDGEKLLFLEVEVNVKLDSCDPYYYYTIVSPIKKLVFPRFGEYSIDVSVDGCHKKSLPVTLSKIKQHLQ